MKKIIIMQADEGIGNHWSSNYKNRGQCDCDCDCACSYISQFPLSAIDQTYTWCDTVGVQAIPLPENWYGLSNPAESTFLAILNQDAYEFWSRFQLHQNINISSLNTEQYNFMLHLIIAGLVRIQKNQLEGKRNIDNWQLTSWLHLTDRCNFRCKYCYLPHVNEDMSLDVGRASIDATFRSALIKGFKQVKLKFSGGEPLLRFPLIVELLTYAQLLAKRNELGLKSVVLSNGTLLTKSIVRTMNSLDIGLMISLDGLDKIHNQHRPYKGGRGSFNDVAKSIDLAISEGMTPSISITVSNQTADSLDTIIKWVLERDLPFSLNFYRENDYSILVEDLLIEEQKIIDGMLKAYSVIEKNLPRNSLLGGIVDRANLSHPHNRPCGVGDNYLVVTQNGAIAKCQMQILNPITDVYAKDPLEVIRIDEAGIQNIEVDEKGECRTCEWKNWCAGGCPLTTYRKKACYNEKSPYCNIYKTLIPEAIRLEGLRLLKFQDDAEIVKKVII